MRMAGIGAEATAKPDTANDRFEAQKRPFRCRHCDRNAGGKLPFSHPTYAISGIAV
jgi:hypothetical protein